MYTYTYSQKKNWIP